LKKIYLLFTLLLVSLFVMPRASAYAQTSQPIVRAVLFYSPTCPHCEHVIKETLIPLVDTYGDQLQIIAIDITQQEGQMHFLSAADKFHLGEVGVPFLVIDDTYLIGSGDIPEKFPGFVETYLTAGGVDWPDIPGLTETLRTTESTDDPSPTATPVVRAVLLYRSTCSHCVKITEEVIPPLLAKFGTQLEIFGVDVSVPEGDVLYDAVIEKYNIETFAIPTLIVGDRVLIGGTDIEENLPGIIERYVSQGGVDWPDIAGLEQAIEKAKAASNESLPSTEVDASSPASPSAGIQGPLLMNDKPLRWTDRFAQDLAGNTLSVIVLIGMIASLAWSIILFKGNERFSMREVSSGWIPLLCLIGFSVAGYLAYVETTQTTAVCGPVGDCNTVQQSDYARLFGVLPIGVLGLLGYMVIFTSWMIARFARNALADPAVILVFALATLGTLFSIYLTFLEPFVIGATCIWCLTSAVLMTVLMLLSVKPAKVSFVKLRTP
jgi:uncharacterized membrane protein/thiol-disulfide isomerase/thioredoxin